MCDKKLADWTGLEPATPGVTGRYSNQLNYQSSVIALQSFAFWWVMTGSNRRPSACKADALPAELITLVKASPHSTQAVLRVNPYLQIFSLFQ